MPSARPSEVFARRIREVRERQRLTQADLAERIGNDHGVTIDRATIARIESGRRGVSLDDLFLFAAALNAAPVHLVVPLSDSDGPVQITPTTERSASETRAWVRGQSALTGVNQREYWTEIPEAEYLAYAQTGMRALLRHVEKLAEAAGAEDADEMGRQLKIIDREIGRQNDAYEELLARAPKTTTGAEDR